METFSLSPPRLQIMKARLGSHCVRVLIVLRPGISQHGSQLLGEQYSAVFPNESVQDNAAEAKDEDDARDFALIPV